MEDLICHATWKYGNINLKPHRTLKFHFWWGKFQSFKHQCLVPYNMGFVHLACRDRPTHESESSNGDFQDNRNLNLGWSYKTQQRQQQQHIHISHTCIQYDVNADIKESLQMACLCVSWKTHENTVAESYLLWGIIQRICDWGNKWICFFMALRVNTFIFLFLPSAFPASGVLKALQKVT